MTSVQQVNYHPGLEKYIFANWAWIDYNGNPRPDHTPDQRNDRTSHQRTQLTLIEGPNPCVCALHTVLVSVVLCLRYGLSWR